jgi:hypothetical protein
MIVKESHTLDKHQNQRSQKTNFNPIKKTGHQEASSGSSKLLSPHKGLHLELRRILQTWKLTKTHPDTGKATMILSMSCEISVAVGYPTCKVIALYLSCDCWDDQTGRVLGTFCVVWIEADWLRKWSLMQKTGSKTKRYWRHWKKYLPGYSPRRKQMVPHLVASAFFYLPRPYTVDGKQRITAFSGEARTRDTRWSHSECNEGLGTNLSQRCYQQKPWKYRRCCCEYPLSLILITSLGSAKSRGYASDSRAPALIEHW